MRLGNTEGDAMEEVHGVILAYEHRLLRGMLERAIKKTPGLQVVGEMTDPDRLQPLLDETGAHWVIVSLAPDGRLPDTVDTLLAAHRSVRILAVACDGSQAKVKGRGDREQVLDDLSLEELVAILRGCLPQDQNADTAPNA